MQILIHFWTKLNLALVTMTRCFLREAVVNNAAVNE